MTTRNSEQMADGSRYHGGRRAFVTVLAAAIVVGALAAWHVASQGLTLSHFDARAHLVVARRVIDSLTPGWRQFGALWLPLPHLLNAVPVQWDAAYRSGFTGVVISIGALSWGLAAVAERAFTRTGSWVVAIVPSALIIADPNVLYLMSTPMSEPLLFGTALLSLAALDAWIDVPTSSRRARAAWFLAALVMTRYEGWPIAAALILAATIANRRQGVAEIGRLVFPSAFAIAAFLGLGYASSGQWFLSSSFFVPEPELFHQPLHVLRVMRTGLEDLANPVILICGAAGAAICLIESRKSPTALLPLSLLAAGALPFAAFYAGHPFRIRYMVMLVVANLLLAGVTLAAMPRRSRTLAGIALVSLAIWARPPLGPPAPVLVEARAADNLRLAREEVSHVLQGMYDGTPILASMGSLGHYMHESSAIGLDLRNFLHEGNGDLWLEALRSPRLSVRWILIEERAEGGDILAARARASEDFLSGFDRVVEAGGLALYRRR